MVVAMRMMRAADELHERNVNAPPLARQLIAESASCRPVTCITRGAVDYQRVRRLELDRSGTAPALQSGVQLE